MSQTLFEIVTHVTRDSCRAQARAHSGRRNRTAWILCALMAAGVIVTGVLTNFMSNTATTALMVPICVSIANRMGADPSAVLMACVIGGSCAYATPIGMPANTMVVTAGGYTFKDYAKAGIPLILVATVVSMILLPVLYPFFP